MQIERFSDISNIHHLGTNALRLDALSILGAGLAAIDTQMVVQSAVSFSGSILTVMDTDYDLTRYERILVAGVGKCAGDAAVALEEILGGNIDGGFVITIGTCPILHRIDIVCGDHPLPTERNIDATKRLLAFLEGTTERDLVIMIVSGGGSTLLCQPEMHTCTEEGALLSVLFLKGATIREINLIRRHISIARGGHLARAAYPATVHALVFSDVPGNDLPSIASGPTVEDTTTVDDAKKILARYSFGEGSPFPSSSLTETPKEKKWFEKVRHSIIVSNEQALSIMEKEAKRLGYKASISVNRIQGEARDVGERIASDIHKVGGRSVILYGGESTVTLRKEAARKVCLGDACGGRNRELALGAISHIKEGEIVLAFASDGEDNGVAAGAIVDEEAKQKAASLGLDPKTYLERNDSGTFFQKLGVEILTGKTGSNVADLVIAIKA